MRAEMTPSEPDPVNTGEGKRRTFSFSAWAALPGFKLLCMVEVTINQQTFQLSDECGLAGVLSLLRIGQADGIAIAVNEAVIPRGEWDGFVLRERDRVFVIRATQGG
jgi:sulfur carrier protein